MPGEPSQRTSSRPRSLGHLLGGATDLRDQFARVLCRDAEFRVDHRPAAGFGDEPLAAYGGSEFDRVFGTVIDANAASFARRRFHAERPRHPTVAGTVEPDGIEAAEFLALPAGGAVAGLDPRLAAAREILAADHLGLEDQVQVGGIHVAVGQDARPGQAGQRGDHRGLARAALAAVTTNSFIVPLR